MPPKSAEEKQAVEISNRQKVKELPNLPEVPQKLTLKQKAFLTEYIKDWNSGAAAARAGYSANNLPQTALHIIRLPHVTEYLLAYQKAYLQSAFITKDYVLLKLQEIVEAGLYPKGKRTKQNLAAATRALELIGRHLVMFGDALPTGKQERITFNINVQSKDANNGARGTEIDITPVPTGSGALGAADAANGRFEGLGSDSTTRPENTPLPAARAGSSSRTPSPPESPPPDRIL
jgi:phage terminase small subunit